MDTIINTLGWLLFIAFLLGFGMAAASFIINCGRLGYCLAFRIVRERRAWKKAVERGNHAVTLHAAYIMRDRLKYGATATLQEIINDTQTKLKATTK